MAADHAQAQVNPGVTHLEAFFATVGTRFHITDLVGVRALVHFLTSADQSGYLSRRSISSELSELSLGAAIGTVPISEQETSASGERSETGSLIHRQNFSVAKTICRPTEWELRVRKWSESRRS
jgi:hypothetical protein